MKVRRWRLLFAWSRIALVIAYLGGYACCRVDGMFVHVERRSLLDQGHEIRVPDRQWIELEQAMAAQSGIRRWELLASVPDFLEAFYTPLRWLEARAWRVLARD